MTIALKQFLAGIIFGIAIFLTASGIYDGALILFLGFILFEFLIYKSEQK
jgi:hypothetical protein